VTPRFQGDGDSIPRRLAATSAPASLSLMKSITVAAHVGRRKSSRTRSDWRT
jgi:hypothetical protein